MGSPTPGPKGRQWLNEHVQDDRLARVCRTPVQLYSGRPHGTGDEPDRHRVGERVDSPLTTDQVDLTGESVGIHLVNRMIGISGESADHAERTKSRSAVGSGELAARAAGSGGRLSITTPDGSGLLGKTPQNRPPRRSITRSAHDHRRAARNTSARWRGSASVPCTTWVRQEKPSASTSVSVDAARILGNSSRSAQACDTS